MDFDFCLRLAYNLAIESPVSRKVLTVTQVARLVTGMLDRFFSDLWIEGEVSNLKSYPSGHLYFTLKDSTAQIPAVCFKSAAGRLKFKLTDGLLIIGHGRIDFYAPSGRFQVILDEIEPKGQGALQLAFEQLKKRLAGEGLFEESRKRPIPKLPRVVGIVTSPSGAAIHDMLRTLRLHRARLKVLIYPVPVQGDGAAQQIAAGVQYLSSRGDVDVILAGRGGGSVEDLWAFNEEIVARAIAASKVPVISGIGHETDFTIADFVADVRAATPTAAAHLVARGWEEQDQRLAEATRGLLEIFQAMLLERERALESLAVRIEREVMELKFRATSRVRTLADRIERPVVNLLQRRLARWETGTARLNDLSPLASLKRGYSICQKPDGSIISRTKQTKTGDRIGVKLSDGGLNCEVLEARSDDHRS